MMTVRFIWAGRVAYPRKVGNLCALIMLVTRIEFCERFNDGEVTLAISVIQHLDGRALVIFSKYLVFMNENFSRKNISLSLHEWWDSSRTTNSTKNKKLNIFDVYYHFFHHYYQFFFFTTCSCNPFHSLERTYSSVMHAVGENNLERMHVVVRNILKRWISDQLHLFLLQVETNSS